MKKKIKKILQLLFVILVTPLFLLVRIFGSDLFVACGQLLALAPGKTGSYLRVAYYRLTLNYCSPDIFIGFGTYFSQQDVMVEEGVYIGAYCIIGKARIRKHVTIASGVHVLSGSKQHGFQRNDVPIQQQERVFEVITIGENSWIGSSCIIMATLGVKNVVGAGSTVTKVFDDKLVLAGNPAKIIKKIV